MLYFSSEMRRSVNLKARSLFDTRTFSVRKKISLSNSVLDSTTTYKYVPPLVVRQRKYKNGRNETTRRRMPTDVTAPGQHHLPFAWPHGTTSDVPRRGAETRAGGQVSRVTRRGPGARQKAVAPES